MTSWHEDDGYITVAVVGLTALTAAIVTALLMLARPTALMTGLGIEQLHQQARIEAGLNTAAFLLFFAGETPSSVDGRRLTIDGGLVEIEVSPEKGRVDINTSSPDLLRRVFAATKGTSMTADAFAARVVDWRDEDDEKTIEGAETFEYEAVPGLFPPSNGPFRAVDELRFLLGLSEEDRARIEPFLTTFNRDGLVERNDAAGPVRAALFGSGLLEGPAPLAGAVEVAASAVSPGSAAETMPEAFRVTIRDRAVAGRAERGAVAIIAPPVRDDETYSLLEWHGLTQPSPGGSAGAMSP